MSDFFSQLEKFTPLATAIFGGIGIKLLDKVLAKRSETFNESAKIREELRGSVNELREEMEQNKNDADEWRRKYWEQVEVNIYQKGLIGTLHSEFEQLKQSIVEKKDLP